MATSNENTVGPQTGLKVVDVRSGEVFDPAYVEGDKFWFQHHLKKDGKPDKRAPIRRIGISRAKNSRYWSGGWALYDARREEQANAKRDEIAKLESQLSARREELYQIYQEQGPSAS